MFSESFKPLRIWWWLVYKFTENVCRLRLFSGFTQTKIRYPSSFDNISIITWKLLIISSQNFSCEVNSYRTYSLQMSHICHCDFNASFLIHAYINSKYDKLLFILIIIYFYYIIYYIIICYIIILSFLILLFIIYYIICIKAIDATDEVFYIICIKAQLTKAIAEMKREHWTKRWNWSSCIMLALSVSRT